MRKRGVPSFNYVNVLINMENEDQEMLEIIILVIE